jgi:class 3 adenylate cyclase
MNLNMRIGLHTGEIIAGITGTNIVRYDIYGADNDIANKMESNGASGRVNVSEVTKALLEAKDPGRFEFAFNKEIRHEPVNRSLESFFVNAVHVEDMV